MNLIERLGNFLSRKNTKLAALQDYPEDFHYLLEEVAHSAQRDGTSFFNADEQWTLLYSHIPISERLTNGKKKKEITISPRVALSRFGNNLVSRIGEIPKKEQWLYTPPETQVPNFFETAYLKLAYVVEHKLSTLERRIPISAQHRANMYVRAFSRLWEPLYSRQKYEERLFADPSQRLAAYEQICTHLESPVQQAQ